MAKELVANSNFARVSVVVNGVSLSMNSEVTIILKQPKQMDMHSRRAWNLANKESAELVTVENLPIVSR